MIFSSGESLHESWRRLFITVGLARPAVVSFLLVEVTRGDGTFSQSAIHHDGLLIRSNICWFSAYVRHVFTCVVRTLIRKQ